MSFGDKKLSEIAVSVPGSTSYFVNTIWISAAEVLTRLQTQRQKRIKFSRN